MIRSSASLASSLSSDYQSFSEGPYLYMPFCEDFRDQTNCSDPKRVGVVCPIDGFPSNVSTAIICKPFYNGLCDDAMDKVCVAVTPACLIHKHQLCDGRDDCAYGEDEDNCRLSVYQVCFEL